jgi:DnaJ-class molecular chaperone
MVTKKELIEENKRLKGLLDHRHDLNIVCYHCKGSGMYWTYGMDEEQRCPYCHGSGRL